MKFEIVPDGELTTPNWRWKAVPEAWSDDYTALIAEAKARIVELGGDPELDFAGVATPRPPAPAPQPIPVPEGVSREDHAAYIAAKQNVPVELVLERLEAE